MNTQINFFDNIEVTLINSHYLDNEESDKMAQLTELQSKQRALINMQSLPLEIKIMKTKNRIREWVEYHGLDGVYVSFSGGKDSTILLHMARELYPTIKACFIDTGLEYPEIKNHVKKFDNVDIVRPKLTYPQVIEKYGYPVVSKEQSKYIYMVRNTNSQVVINKHLHGINRDGSKTQFKISDKHKYLLEADFKISHYCCDVMKKRPVHKYEKDTGRVPIMGTMAQESKQRMRDYLNYGCNSFDTNTPKSQPMGFWTEADVLEYIKLYNIEIPEVYGEIITAPDGSLETTGVNRTGCVFCMFGVGHEPPDNNRFTQLEQTHPKIHDYCINKLGLGDVLDYMNINYSNKNKELDEAI